MTATTVHDRPQRLVFPEETLRVRGWADPVLDQHGWPLSSDYTDLFWLPVLSPSSLALARRLVVDLAANPEGFTVATEDLAASVGLGLKGGRHGPLWRAIDRLHRFGVARRQGPLLAVRTHLAPLTSRQVDRLPASLQARHLDYLTGPTNG